MYNEHGNNQLEGVGGRVLPKPHHLEELQLRSTHYGGAVDKLLTTQKIGSGFKGGLPNQLAGPGSGVANQQATP